MLHCIAIKTQKGWYSQINHFSRRGMRQIHFNLCFHFLVSVSVIWYCRWLLTVLKPFGYALLLPGPWHKRVLISLLNGGAHAVIKSTSLWGLLEPLASKSFGFSQAEERYIYCCLAKKYWSSVHNCVAFWSILAGWFPTLSQFSLCLDKECIQRTQTLKYIIQQDFPVLLCSNSFQIYSASDKSNAHWKMF